MLSTISIRLSRMEAKICRWKWRLSTTTALKTTLKAEINADAWASLHSDTSRPFTRPESGRIAVKVINHLDDEVMKVCKV